MNLVKNSVISGMLKEHEGYSAKPYKCSAGKITIGYGHNLEDKGLPKNVCEIVLAIDIGEALRQTLQMFPLLKTYSKNRQLALIDMMFNLGSGRLAGFKKMRSAITEQNWELAAIEAKDSKWFKQVGSRGIKVASWLENG